MAYIQSHQTLWSHRKTNRLVRSLKIDRLVAIGLLHSLWWWCLDNAPDGSLKKIDPEDIADGAHWEGDPREFLNALTYAGFVDDDGEDLLLHDWDDYAGRLIDKREANAERMRLKRALAKQSTTGNGASGDHTTSVEHDNDVQDTCDAHAVHVQGLEKTREEKTREEKILPQTPKGDLQSDSDTSLEPDEVEESVLPGEKASLPTHKPEEFRAFYKAYPRHDAPRDAAKAWDFMKPDVKAVDKIMEVLSTLEGRSWNRSSRVKCKQPGAWLRASRWKSEDPFPGLVIYDEEQEKEARKNSVGGSTPVVAPVVETRVYIPHHQRQPEASSHTATGG